MGFWCFGSKNTVKKRANAKRRSVRPVNLSAPGSRSHFTAPLKAPVYPPAPRYNRMPANIVRSGADQGPVREVHYASHDSGVFVPPREKQSGPTCAQVKNENRRIVAAERAQDPELRFPHRYDDSHTSQDSLNLRLAIASASKEHMNAEPASAAVLAARASMRANVWRRAYA